MIDRLLLRLLRYSQNRRRRLLLIHQPRSTQSRPQIVLSLLLPIHEQTRRSQMIRRPLLQIHRLLQNQTHLIMITLLQSY
jgi:hypothetical protein